MRTISIMNTIEGCGKTTTAINLACSLGWKGLKVLLVDMDPQAHASLGVNLKCDAKFGVYELFEQQVSIEEVILKSVLTGIDMIPATAALSRVENVSNDIADCQTLVRHLDRIEHMYDYIVIDCPARINYLSNNALIAADEVIIPTEMNLISVESINSLIRHINDIEQCSGLALPYSILPTMVDYRTRLARTFLNTILQRFPDKILPFMIHTSVRVREAVCQGIPIIDYDADSITTDDFKLLACEIIQHDTLQEDIWVEYNRKISSME